MRCVTEMFHRMDLCLLFEWTRGSECSLFKPHTVSQRWRAPLYDGLSVLTLLMMQEIVNYLLLLIYLLTYRPTSSCLCLLL